MNQKYPSLIPLTFILLCFGTFAFAADAPPKLPTPEAIAKMIEKKSTEQAEALQDRLKLNKEKRAKVEPILIHFEKQRMDLFKEVGERIRAIELDRDNQIKGLLTAEQQKAYDQFLIDQKKAFFAQAQKRLQESQQRK